MQTKAKYHHDASSQPVITVLSDQSIKSLMAIATCLSQSVAAGRKHETIVED